MPLLSTAVSSTVSPVAPGSRTGSTAPSMIGARTSVPVARFRTVASAPPGTAPKGREAYAYVVGSPPAGDASETISLHGPAARVRTRSPDPQPVARTERDGDQRNGSHIPILAWSRPSG